MFALGLGHAILSHLKNLKSCALRNLCVQCGSPFPPGRFLCSLSALLSRALRGSGEAFYAVAAAMLLSWLCTAAALLSIDRPRLSSHPARALILSRTGSRTIIRSAFHFPTSWINVQEVLSDAGNACCKD